MGSMHNTGHRRVQGLGSNGGCLSSLKAYAFEEVSFHAVWGFEFCSECTFRLSRSRRIRFDDDAMRTRKYPT